MVGKKKKTKKKWIQSAINPAHKGQLTKKAKAAGMSVSQYCNTSRAGYNNLDSHTKRQCALARRLKTY